MPERPTFNPDQEPKNEFDILREQVHKDLDLELQQRIEANPHPTDEELMAGAFKEMIEPQVRNAVFEFRRKGYRTLTSGFDGHHSRSQFLDGYFQIDEETKAKLANLGATVLTGAEAGLQGQNESYSNIQFNPETADLESIKATWDAIAAALPDKGVSAPPSTSGAAEDFLRQYAPERTDIERMMLETDLADGDFSPEAMAKMKARLEELSK